MSVPEVGWYGQNLNHTGVDSGRCMNFHPLCLTVSTTWFYSVGPRRDISDDNGALSLGSFWFWKLFPSVSPIASTHMDGGKTFPVAVMVWNVRRILYDVDGYVVVGKTR